MKIIFISDELPYPNNSGGRIYTWERLNALKSKGHDIYLYSFRENNEQVSHKINEVCKENSIYLKNNKLKSVMNFLYPYNVFIFKSNNMYNDIMKKIHNDHIDCIIINFPQLLINCPINKNIPIILTQHNIEYNLIRDMGKSKQGIKKIFFIQEAFKMKKFEERFYKSGFINGYTFISQQDMKFFKNHYNKSKCIYIPQGIKCENFTKDICINIKKKREKIIVFTGKMNYYPNIQAVKWFVNDIFPKIKKVIPNVKFYIVGKNPKSEIIRLANDNIIVTGKVKSISKYINKADLVVIPLKSGGGVKIKLLEAFQHNKIIVSTSKGIEGTNFINGKHLLVSNDSQGFADCCIRVLSDIDNYLYLPKNAKRLLSEEYNVEKIANKYNHFIEEIIATGRA